jgi:hypothetical protein
MFYRTVFRIEVLSEGPLPEDISLEDVAYEIMDGDYSGNIKRVSEDEVDGPTMARLLREQGSDPEFFRLTDDGQEVED